MMLKKTNIDNQDKLLLLRDRVRHISNELELIVRTHDKCSFTSEQEAGNWLKSLPIETLNDSLLKDYGINKKISLQMINKKSKLRKDYDKTFRDLEQAVHEMNIANIDCLIEKIDKIL